MRRINENTVKAEGQVAISDLITVKESGAGLRVLFVGNSITKHGPSAEIGWHGNWGMAASLEEADYVHVAVSLLEKKYGAVDYMICQASRWERKFWDISVLDCLAAARDFAADVVVIRLGDNMWNVRDEFEKHDMVSHYTEMVSFFASKPEAKVIVTDLFWRGEPIDNMIHEAAKRAGYTLVEIGDLGASDENMAIGRFEHHGVAVHPGDLGMRRIAERIVEKI